MPVQLDYAVPGPLTDLRDLPPDVLPVLTSGADPLTLTSIARGLLLQPVDAQKAGLPPDRFATSDVRPATALLGAVLELDPSPLELARPPERRIVGTCRHVAVLTVAFLRHAGVAARARCGFATYVEPGRGVDHWVVELREPRHGPGWVRVDPELPDLGPQPGPDPGGEFLTGGEAWSAYRLGTLDAARFGVAGTRDAWGPAEIKGNAIRDLAALNKVEVLPWDEWGRMTDAYSGRTGHDHDALVDAVAAVCAGDDPAFVTELYARDELRVPAALQR